MISLTCTKYPFHKWQWISFRCRDNTSVPIPVVTNKKCNYTPVWSTEKHCGCQYWSRSCKPFRSIWNQPGFWRVHVTLAFVFVLCILCLSFLFCWPLSCLSSDLTIFVCPFIILELFLKIFLLFKEKTKNFNANFSMIENCLVIRL